MNYERMNFPICSYLINKIIFKFINKFELNTLLSSYDNAAL